MIITLGADMANRPCGIYGNDISEFCYIPIMKNAHTWGVKFFQENFNFRQIRKPDEAHDIPQNKKFIIIFRDPTDRWYSGVAQYFYMHMGLDPARDYKLDDHMINLIFNAVKLDGHTDNQISYLLGLNFSNCYFFNFNDKEFEFKLKLFTQRINLGTIKKDIAPINQTKNSVLKNSIIKQLLDAQITNPSLFKNVTQFYKPDMQLYHYLQTNVGTFNSRQTWKPNKLT